MTGLSGVLLDDRGSSAEWLQGLTASLDFVRLLGSFA
jgi:hypothetical protein